MGDLTYNILGFLELINNMLSSGIVPALFPDDERESIINQIRNEASSAGFGPSKESIWQYFVNKCASNLHIILCMSPVSWKYFCDLRFELKLLTKTFTLLFGRNLNFTVFYDFVSESIRLLLNWTGGILEVHIIVCH